MAFGWPMCSEFRAQKTSHARSRYDKENNDEVFPNNVR